MKKNRLIGFGLAGIVVLLLIIGVPIVINELYKKNSGYMTIWSAADVLSYYGMIIAAFIGVAGVYFTVYISTKQYREDARNRILPIIAVNGITQNQPELLFSELNNAFSTQEDLLDQADGWLFFSINKKNIAVLRKPKKDDLVMILESTVIRKRGTTDDRMYVRDSENVCLPLEIENVGNGIAKRLSVGLCKKVKARTTRRKYYLSRMKKEKYIYFLRKKSMK